MTTRATLCYIVKDEKILLINKKRGFGAGKWNGPGGKICAGESPAAAAARETEEETGLRPKNIKDAGILEFYFGQKEIPDMTVHIFIADDFSGSMTESEEATPGWFSVSDIPFSKMWPYDKIWMPLMLQGKRVNGAFYFDESMDKIMDYVVKEA